MNKLALSIFVATAVIAIYLAFGSIEQKDQYLAWKAKYGYQCSQHQDHYRKIIYQQNVEKIKKHNEDPSQTFLMGVNQFAALSNQQFQRLYLRTKKHQPPQTTQVATTISKITADIDWVAKGMVTPIKNQGSCGSCWAFSAVGVLQSWAKTKGQTVSLSQQQLVDCSRKYGNQGCDGGYHYLALAYVKDKGITDNKTYPYKAQDQSCKTQGGNFKITNVPTAKGCNGIIQAIQLRVIGVDVDASRWPFYHSGILSRCQTDINHAVTLVGYTSTYYKIKNSWGTTWGENGYIRLAPGNTCGICIDEAVWVQ